MPQIVMASPQHAPFGVVRGIPGEGAIAPDVGIQDVLQCATCHYRHRTGAEDSQTPVRNSDPMAVESRRDLASRHGSIVRIAAGAPGLIAPTILSAPKPIHPYSDWLVPTPLFEGIEPGGFKVAHDFRR